jgi:hypothetical protein
LPVPESTWLALRARGEKLGETSVVLVDSLKGALTYVDRPSNAELLRRFSQKKGPRPTAAHTAPVYVTVAGTPAIAEQPKASEAARAWSARLDELEALLAEDRLPKLARFPGRGDGLKLNDLRSGRAELLRAIASARAAYHQWPAQSTTPSQQRR